mmetsp:Transcript_4398/g.6385  ORF Transcript_4398/g.6385 Transcript_4398/m.6385 type:complete len:190 (+) Transcript_4398:1094-1663(+)
MEAADLRVREKPLEAADLLEPLKPKQEELVESPAFENMVSSPGLPPQKQISSEDFKLLIRVMGHWKTFAKTERETKKEQVASTQKLILAIDFHEKSLALKVFRSCLANKMKKRRVEYGEKAVREMVQQNIIRFYFQTMRTKFLRAQKRRYLRLIAKDYRKEETVKRCFSGWRKRAATVKEQLQNLRAKL